MSLVISPSLMDAQGYCVYEHVFPDGKRYIGITRDIKKRWTQNGKGYDHVKKMRDAIDKFGWENIQHNIIAKGMQRAEAQKLERYLIKSLDTIKNGYNQREGGETGPTYFSKHVMHMIRLSKTVNAPYLEDFYSSLSSLSDMEDIAININMIDLHIQYKPEFQKLECDPLIQCAYYSHCMAKGLEGKDVSKIPEYTLVISEKLEGIRRENK